MYGFSEKGHFTSSSIFFFGLGAAPLVFSKILAVPILLLRRLQIYVILGRHVTYVTDTRRVIHEQRCNNFSSDSIRTYSISKSQFEKVCPSASPTNRISSVGHEMKVLLPQGR